ncbi:MAG: BrnT family toxin [Candidatus Aegiribacteria sp.]|nr:BrnT family toxin [Candidatus Aegiribacteria sp.]
MLFEYDTRKSKKNEEKHRIDFEKAQKLWDDPDLIEIPARTEDESRYMVIGMIDRILWSGIITYRDSSIRIISVRRSRDEEVIIYEG